MTAQDGLYEIRNGGVSWLVPNFGLGQYRFWCCHLDEPNGLLFVNTDKKIFTISVPTAGERRAAHIFPLVSLWALTQRDRAGVMPATGAIGVDEANMRAVLSRLMRVRASGVVGLVLRFAL